VHSLDAAGRAAVRIVLGDWYEQDSVLIWSKDGYRLGRVSDLAVWPGFLSAPFTAH
jgi:hypothetical protein